MSLSTEPSVTIPYEELDGSPQEKYGDSGFTATRKLMCSWTSRHTLARQLKGGRQVIGDQQVTIKGATYPWNAVARVANVSIDGDGKPESETSTELYEKAILTVDYSIPKFDEETLIEESIEPASEFLTLPVNNLYWGYGENKVALGETEAPGLLIQMYDWIYTIKAMRNPPDWIGELEGCVNSKQVKSDTLNRTFAPETLLVGKPNLSRTITTAGEKAWTVTFRFTYRRIPWNLFPRVDIAGPNGIPFEPITNGVQAIKIFTPADFSRILI